MNPFQEPLREQVGERAYNTWDLLHSGVKMADGFVVTTLAMADFFVAANLYDKIGALLLDSQPGNEEETAEEIADLILGANFPQMIITPIHQAYRQLGGFASRPVEVLPSSLMLSDSRDQQSLDQKTLVANTEAKLIFAIKTAWAQQFDAELVQRLKQNNNFAEIPLLAVQVTRLTQAETSGEAYFPAQNRSEDAADHAEVSASLGNFDPLRSESDYFEVDLQENEVFSRTVLPQTTMLVWQQTENDNKLAEIPVSEHWQTEPKISDSLALQVGQLARRICEHLGYEAIRILWSATAGKIVVNKFEQLSLVETIPTFSLQEEVNKKLPNVPDSRATDYRSLLADVQALAAEATEIESETGRNETELQSHAAYPDTEKLRTTVGVHISNLSSGQLEAAKSYSAIFYDAKFMLGRHRILPEEVQSDSKQFKELVQVYADDLATFVLESSGRPIYYKFSSIDEEVSPLIRTNSRKALESKDLARLIENPSALFAEVDAINKVRFQDQSVNFRLIVPRLRSAHELEQIKKLLSSEGVKRARNMQVWIELALPVLLHHLDEIETSDIDGIFIDLPVLATKLVDSAELRTKDWELTFSALTRALGTRSMPVAINMPPKVELLEMLAASELNVASVIITHSAQQEFWDQLAALDWSLPKLRVRRSRGRPVKPLFV